jgi:hypothetical protein
LCLIITCFLASVYSYFFICLLFPEFIFILVYFFVAWVADLDVVSFMECFATHAHNLSLRWVHIVMGWFVILVIYLFVYSCLSQTGKVGYGVWLGCLHMIVQDDIHNRRHLSLNPDDEINYLCFSQCTWRQLIAPMLWLLKIFDIQIYLFWHGICLQGWVFGPRESSYLLWGIYFSVSWQLQPYKSGLA